MTRPFTSRLLVAAGVALSLGTLAATPAAAQHVHGKATLDLGFDGASGQAVFRAPGDDVYGFERAPRTAAERARQAAALAVLREQAAALIVLDRSLGCTVAPDTVSVKTDKGGHGEVEARYTITCKAAPTGKPIRFAFSKAFPGVERVVVQLVTDRTQTSATITRDKGVVTP